MHADIICHYLYDDNDKCIVYVTFHIFKIKKDLQIFHIFSFSRKIKSK